jgi:predicted unusual protein kinase regulating ubiquinone biosynthesis (AarF/ABC1/UbiB family)
MKLTRQFTIICEGYKQYAAFKKFAGLSLEQRATSKIPSKLPPLLMNLGPTFIKLGQILSTRADMLPKE